MLQQAICPTLVCMNSGAGSASGLEEFFASLRQDPQVALLDLSQADDLEAPLEKAVSEGRERIVAAGGDGTISSVAAALHLIGARQTGLAVLPLGSGNDFSRTLGMPLEAEEAWNALWPGHVGPLDLLEITTDNEKRVAVNMVTAGNTGAYMDALTDDIKQRWGAFCYLRGVVDVVRNLTTFEGRIHVDGELVDGTEWLNLFVANGRYSGGGLLVSSQARLNNGQFHAVLINEGQPTELASLAGQYLIGDFEEHNLVSSRAGREIRLQSTQLWPCTADGETFEAHEFVIRVLPGALQVVFPNEPLV